MLKNLDVGVTCGWVLRAVSTVMAAALLASCGGEAAEKFQPTRVTAFGDEMSAINDGSANATPTVGGDGNGRKYGVNAAPSGSPSVSNCAANPIWVQVVAYSFGYGFQQCRGTQALNQLGRTWAQPGATVSAANGADTIAGQIQDFRDAGGVFNDKDLVLLMAGMHDVLARYRQYNSADADNSRNTLAGLAEQDGLALGQLVVQMTNEGAKVIVAVVPDQGLSPYADAEETARPSEGRRATLRALTTAFNKGLQDKMQEVRGGGRSAGLVLSDALHADFYASNNPYGFTDPPPALTPTCIPVTAPGAFPALPPAPVTTCDDASGHVKVGNYLWADYLRYSPIGHSVLGSAASSRAHDNPF